MTAHRLAAASVLFAAATIWPWLVRSLTNLVMTPLERALQSSWCGPAPLDTLSFLGHCALCWAGALVLATTGLIVLTALDGAHPSVRASAPPAHNRQRR